MMAAASPQQHLQVYGAMSQQQQQQQAMMVEDLHRPDLQNCTSAVSQSIQLQGGGGEAGYSPNPAVQ